MSTTPRNPSRLSQVLRAGLAISAPNRALEPDEDDPHPEPWYGSRHNPNHSLWRYPMRAKQEPSREYLWSQMTDADRERGRGSGGGGGHVAYSDPWPLSMVDLAKERARPADERQALSSILFSWWVRKLTAEAADEPTPTPDMVNRVWKERYRLASRLARSDYQTAFPDDPPSDLSDSDDGMKQDQMEQHAALLKAQHAALLKAQRKAQRRVHHSLSNV